MKKIALSIVLTVAGYQGICCTTCNLQLQQKIYDSTFYPNLLTMLSAFLVLTLIVVLLAYFSNRKYAGLRSKNPDFLNPVPLTTAAMVLGIGIGGFIDGIVLHQILQWHAMISNKLPPATLQAKSVNMFWDGIFHAFVLMVVFTGMILLWKLLHRKGIEKSGSLLTGGLLAGWGLFNIVEGVIDHHLLKLHFVRENTIHTDWWNYGFLIISVIFILVGYFLIRVKQVRSS